MASAKKITKEPVRKLTAHDLAFGIGRKITDEEWELLYEETKDDIYTDSDIVMKRISKELAKVNKSKIVTSKV